jgi:hypothetical protein
MSTEEGCCGRTLIFSTRWSTAAVALIGTALTGYSCYLLAESSHVTIVSGTILSFGLLDILTGVVIAWIGLHSRCCLDSFFWGFGLLTLVQLVVAILFFVPSTRQSIIDEIQAGVSPISAPLQLDREPLAVLGRPLTRGLRFATLLLTALNVARCAGLWR